MHPNPLLGGDRAGQVGVELVFPHRLHARVHVADARIVEHPLAPVGEQGDLLGVRDRDRIALVVGDPDDLAVGRFRRQLDPLGRQRLGQPGDLDGPLGDLHRRFAA